MLILWCIYIEQTHRKHNLLMKFLDLLAPALDQQTAGVEIAVNKLTHYYISKINELRRTFFGALTEKLLKTHYNTSPVSTIRLSLFYQKYINYSHNAANCYAKMFL